MYKVQVLNVLLYSSTDRYLKRDYNKFQFGLLHNYSSIQLHACVTILITALSYQGQSTERCNKCFSVLGIVVKEDCDLLLLIFIGTQTIIMLDCLALKPQIINIMDKYVLINTLITKMCSFFEMCFTNGTRTTITSTSVVLIC